jgi:hypothetical protein
VEALRAALDEATTGETEDAPTPAEIASFWGHC